MDLKTGQTSYETFVNVWQKTRIFVPVEPFLGPQNPLQDGKNFGQSSDNSTKVWFIPLAYLLVFISRIDSLFHQKIFENMFIRYFLFILKGKSVKTS